MQDYRSCIGVTAGDLFAQRGQAGFGVVDFGLAGIGVLPEVEEFAVVLDRALLILLILRDLPQPIKAFGIQVAEIPSSRRQTGQLFELHSSLIKIPGLVVGEGKRIKMEGVSPERSRIKVLIIKPG